MKKINLLAAALVFLLISIKVQAQTTGADYFEGTWSVLVKDLPDGDVTMIFSLEKNDSGLTGAMQDSTGTELIKLDEVKLSDSTATLYFYASGYDIYLEMNKKDEDHVSGTLMGMFGATGERIK